MDIRTRSGFDRLSRKKTKRKALPHPETARPYHSVDLVEISAPRARREFNLKTDGDGIIKQTLQGLGSIFAGVASYMGLHRPVSKHYRECGIPSKQALAPKLQSILDRKLARGSTVCPKEEAAYKGLNESLAGRYPTLEKVVQDPEEFVADIRGRFEAQKALTPEDPYSFDFSDYAVPVMSQVEEAIGKEMGELSLQVKLRRKLHEVNGNNERKVGLKFLGELRSEVSERIQNRDFSYRRTQELGYYSALALGYFDHEDIHLRDRALLKIDSYLQSEDKVDISEEYRRFKDNEFTVHQKDAHWVSGFQHVEDRFAEAFFNPEEMELVNLPSLEHLDQEPFIRLLNQDIYLSGIAADPLSADGFVRQGRLFWLHDVRHNSAIFVKRKQYHEKHQMSPEQIKKMDRRMDVWNVELQAAMNEIEDPQLEAAVDTLVFNYHHDRGLPFAPSTYDKNELKLVTKALRMMWGIAGQDTRFDQPRKRLKQAQKWLEAFWKPRRAQETAILQAGKNEDIGR